MPDDQPIYVWQKINKDEVYPAGQLTFIPSRKKKPEKYIFDYNPDFEGVVSLIAAEDRVTYEGRLPPFFEMNLPEGARMQAVTEHYGKVLPENMAHLLTFSGLNSIGCLAYSYSNKGIETVTIPY